MTNPLAQDLGGVVLLPCPMCGGEAHLERQGHVACTTGWPCVHTAYFNWGTPAEQNAAAIAAWNRRTHSAEIAGALRDAERWQTIESAPRDGSAILAIVRWMWSDKTPGEAQAVVHWHKAGFWACAIPMNYLQSLDEGVNPTHWRPLPAPPTQDSAMQQGGGGGE